MTSGEDRRRDHNIAFGHLLSARELIRMAATLINRHERSEQVERLLHIVGELDHEMADVLANKGEA